MQILLLNSWLLLSHVATAQASEIQVKVGDDSDHVPTIAEATQKLLRNHLQSLGFTDDQVEPVVSELLGSFPPGQSSGQEYSIINNVLDQLSQEAKPLQRQEDGRDKSGERASSSPADMRPPGASSSRSMFAGVAEVGRDESERGSITESQAAEMSYNGFLERLRRPGSRDLVDAVRRFLASAIGPRGDGHPPRSADDSSDYEYKGLEDLASRTKGFLGSMEATMAQHPAWRHASEDTQLKARDGMEKYVMLKLHPFVFAKEPADAEEDRRLSERVKVLGFLTPDHLDMNPAVRNEVVLSIAGEELRKINRFATPGEKIGCIVKCCSVIFSVLNLAGGGKAGADDFLPVFIYVVLKAGVEHLHSNCEYIRLYRNQADLQSKAGYCFVNLCSAYEFISSVEGSMLTIEQEEFDRQLAAGEARVKAEREAEAAAAAGAE